jgi:hypothetical protein
MWGAPRPAEGNVEPILQWTTRNTKRAPNSTVSGVVEKGPSAISN